MEEGPRTMNVLPFTIASERSAGISYVQRVADNYNLSFSYIEECDQSSFNFVLSTTLIQSNIDILLTYYDGVITLENLPCQYYMTKHSNFLSSLIPTNDINKVVQNILSTYFFNKIMIGIHIRVHNDLFDWSVVPPSGPNTQDSSQNQSSAMKFGEGASIEEFKIILDQIDTKFTSKDIKHHRYFIASNNQNIKNEMLKLYPDSIILSGDYSRSHNEGIKFALVEWLLLSHSDLVINTYGSSFAVEAASRYLKPIIGIWDSHAIYYNDIRLPYCGHMQYMKTHSSQGIAQTYKEGTFDNREVKGKIFSLKSSNILSNWGIHQVYTTRSDHDS